MLLAYMDHDLNVIGALVVVLGDRIRDATEGASGMGGALPAALSALHEWAGGRTIETLAGGLRLSHSRTVRVVDRLEAQGLARRAPDPADGRGVLVHLTPAGRRAGRRVLDARAAALETALPRDERGELAAIAERLLALATSGRRAAGANCRLCDAHACGHHDGRCPVTRAADAAEAAS
jgi:MarR family transcriptional regulator, negative regulator of the multidrug operon emrRAB